MGFFSNFNDKLKFTYDSDTPYLVVCHEKFLANLPRTAKGLGEEDVAGYTKIIKDSNINLKFFPI